MIFLEDIYDVVNIEIERAFFEEKYQLNFYEYLKSQDLKREQVLSFINSTLFISIKDQVEELDLYLTGGDSASFVREAYGWISKPRARKIKDYLSNIMEDANKYEQSKRRGRKPGSKNKKKTVTTSNK